MILSFTCSINLIAFHVYEYVKIIFLWMKDVWGSIKDIVTKTILTAYDELVQNFEKVRISKTMLVIKIIKLSLIKKVDCIL